MIINYYILNYDENDELLAFEAINKNDILKTSYKKLKGESLTTNIYSLCESLHPFIENKKIFSLLKNKDVSCLPIVEIDNEIVNTGKLLSIEDLSSITDMGITIQKEP